MNTKMNLHLFEIECVVMFVPYRSIDIRNIYPVIINYNSTSWFFHQY